MNERRTATWEEVLHEIIGEPSFRVVRALDNGEDGYTVWRQWNEDTLSQSRADVLAFARSRGGIITTNDMEEQPQWSSLSPSSRSNLLNGLLRRRLLIRDVDDQLVEGGGRRYVYLVWR